MGELIQKIESLKSLWMQLSEPPLNLKEWNISHVDKDKIAFVFDECIALLLKLQSSDWQAPVSLAIQDAESNIAEIQKYLANTITTADAQKDFSSFIWWLQLTLLELRYASTFSSDRVYSAEVELLSITNQISKANERLNQLNEIAEKLRQYHEDGAASHEKINTSKSIITEIQLQMQQSVANVLPVEAQIRELLSSAEKNSSTISKYTGDIEELRKQYKELHSKLVDDNATLDGILETSTKHQEVIQKTIEDASRLGMAGSFKMRKDELVRPMFVWGLLFFVGVTALFTVGILEVIPLLKSQFDWVQLLGRTTIVAPCVWLAWFSVKQFGHTLRLWEDYSFKYASAMAFEGYKKEAANISKDMIQLLMEVSIVNFSSNPLRVFDSKSNHGSPLNELTDQSKGLLQNILEFSKKKE